MAFAAGVPTAKDPICSQPLEEGRCLALIPKFGYDTAKGKCVKFNYGGCGGNQNNFAKLEDCQKKCEV